MLPATGCLRSAGRRAYSLSASLCCEITHTKAAPVLRADLAPPSRPELLGNERHYLDPVAVSVTNERGIVAVGVLRPGSWLAVALAA